MHGQSHLNRIAESQMAFDARSFLKTLRAEVATHPSVNHPVLTAIGEGSCTREDFKRFGLQHFALVGMFTQYMERLLINAPNATAKLWLAKVLVDEYGEGSDGDDHTTLYRHFLTRTGVGPDQENHVPLHDDVVDFIRTHLELCSHHHFLVGLGALGPAHEWAIPDMFAPLIKGLRRAGFKEEEILYFPLHVEQDQDHADWLEEALASMISSWEEAELVREGTMLSLAARGRVWDAVGSVLGEEALVPADAPKGYAQHLHRPVKQGLLSRLSDFLAGDTAYRLPQARDLANRIPIRKQDLGRNGARITRFPDKARRAAKGPSSYRPLQAR